MRLLTLLFRLSKCLLKLLLLFIVVAACPPLAAVTLALIWLGRRTR